MEISKELSELIHNCVLKIKEPVNESMHYLIESAVEKQFSYALGKRMVCIAPATITQVGNLFIISGLAPGTAHRIIAIMRDWENLESGQLDYEVLLYTHSFYSCALTVVFFRTSKSIPPQNPTKNPNTSWECLENVSCLVSLPITARRSGKETNSKQIIINNNNNIIIISVPWKAGGIDEEDEQYESYLAKFRKTVSIKIQSLVNKSLEDEPELKSKKKIVNVCFF